MGVSATLFRAGSTWSSWRSEKSDPTSFNWKNKISSMWNSIKYSGTWMHLSDDNYSSEDFKLIVLLGQFYYPEGSGVFSDFCRDYYSRIWITYRTGMPPLLGSTTTSDCGWGCMIRTTQMALAHAIVVNRLRVWRFHQEAQLAPVFYYLYYLIKDCQSAPLGIHRLLEISCADGVAVNPIGRWYAPSEVLSLVKKALKLSLSPLTSDLSLLLAVDGQVVVGDAERESRAWSKCLLLFVPLRLGTNRVNPLYNYHVRHILSLRTCLGIIGGKPDHSLYFIGCFGHDVIYLDPHVAQEYVPISVLDRSSLEGEEKKRKHPLCTYHCHSFSKMAMKDMDPSCVVGFIALYHLFSNVFRQLNSNQVIDMDLGPGEGSKRTKDPLFSVRYHEAPMYISHQEVTDDERRQALEHGFEML
ncbi:unnamed protein product [Angiostrongylus costaricensis]|uniref:Cysteine protease n=1 Tax=Angiostrongylus costaricensis TaxID=334426 RepID=A0A0R3PK30_ANGCS|nr:unnamed protein product [Angiostrongylus costaricensis]